MSFFLRKAVEEKKRQLANQLIQMGIREDKETLLEKSITELEQEFDALKEQSVELSK